MQGTLMLMCTLATCRVMTDSWFDEYNFQVAVDIDMLSPEIAVIMAQTPTSLPAWDPMGALAGLRGALDLATAVNTLPQIR